jgi:hypothetical protein
MPIVADQEDLGKRRPNLSALVAVERDAIWDQESPGWRRNGGFD